MTLGEPEFHAGETAHTAPEAEHDTSPLGRELDADHDAETNGRMSICRHCGARTAGPHGRHDPAPRNEHKLQEWLSRQARLASAERMRRRSDT